MSTYYCNVSTLSPCGSSVLYLESMLNLSIPRDTEQQRKCRKGEFDCLQIPYFLKEIGDIVVVIDGGNRSIRRKPPNCRKSVTNLITYCIEYTSPGRGSNSRERNVTNRATNYQNSDMVCKNICLLDLCLLFSIRRSNNILQLSATVQRSRIKRPTSDDPTKSSGY
jgi:hypothetical protein